MNLGVLKEQNTKPRFKKISNPSVPMMTGICCFAKQEGTLYFNAFVYDEVWPQQLLAQCGNDGPAVWREIKRLMKANLVYELVNAENIIKSVAEAIRFDRYTISYAKQLGFTIAAMRTVLPDAEKRSA